MERSADATHICLCATDHVGLDLLRAELLRIAGWLHTGESLYLARERHLAALKSARSHLDIAAELAVQNDQAPDLFAEELRLAQERLNSITGAFTSDDLLGGHLQPVLHRNKVTCAIDVTPTASLMEPRSMNAAGCAVLAACPSEMANFAR